MDEVKLSKDHQIQVVHDEFFMNGVLRVLQNAGGNVFTVTDNPESTQYFLQNVPKDHYPNAMQFIREHDSERAELILNYLTKELLPIEVEKNFTIFCGDKKKHEQKDLQVGNSLVEGGRGQRPHEGGVFWFTSFPEEPFMYRTYIIPIANIAGKDSKFLSWVVYYAEKEQKMNVFTNEIIRGLVKFKWEKFASRMFFKDFLVLLALSICFIIHIVYFDDFSQSDNIYVYSLGLFAMCLSFIGSCYFLYHEICQIKSSFNIETNKKELTRKMNKNTTNNCDEDDDEGGGNVISNKFFSSRDIKVGANCCEKITNCTFFRGIFFYKKLSRYAFFFGKYFFDPWNFVQFFTSTFMIVLLSVQFYLASIKARNTYHTTVLSALTPPLLAAEVLFYMGGVPSTSQLMRMTLAVTNAAIGVAYILLALICFFAGSYTLLFKQHPEFAFRDYFASWMSVYGFLFGNYDEVSLEEASSPTLAKVLLITFLFIVVIVYLNLIIAIMNDIYSGVRDNAEAQATYGRAKLVLEYECFMSDHQKKNKEYFPDWLYILKKTENDHKVNSSRKTQIHLLEQTANDLLSQIKDLKEEMGMK